MSNIKLYIATSLDGFIAREDGSLDWLFVVPNPNEIDHGYGDFYASVDVVVMGRKTYEEIMGFDVEWPYADSQTFVITRDTDFTTQTEKTEVMTSIDLERLKARSQKGIWLVGGGELISEFLKREAIDEMILSVVPTIIGKGIRLFPNEPPETKFQLVKAEPFETGIVNLHYRRG